MGRGASRYASTILGVADEEKPASTFGSQSRASQIRKNIGRRGWIFPVVQSDTVARETMAA